MEDHDETLLEGLMTLLVEAVKAAFLALLALLLVLGTLLARALQAIFILARPGVLMGCVALAGYTTLTLFSTVLAQYGGDLPAALLALATVTIVPAALLMTAQDSGAWAIMLGVAITEFLARLGLEHAPPPVLALLPVMALSGTVLYFLRGGDNHLPDDNSGAYDAHIEKEQTNVEQERNLSSLVARDGEPDHLHRHTEL